MSTYLIVILVSLSMPLLLSFDRKVHFYSYWKYLFPGILLTMLLFIPWDILFTLNSVWGFNEEHILGLYIFHLPIEEWMFFIVIPYVSIFSYEVFKAYLKKDYFGKYSVWISIFMISLFITIAILNIQKAYTFVSFLLVSIAIFLNQFVFKVKFMGWFYFTFMIVLIPFLIVNGVLTGSFIENEVVWYNNSENLSVRLFTIPVEDVAYGMLLLLMNISFYEYFKFISYKSELKI